MSTKVNKDQLVREISIEEFLPLNQTEELVDAIFDKITRNLANGNEVCITGFGKFEAVERASRKGNLNGEETEIPARIYPKFTPGAALKRAVIKEV